MPTVFASPGLGLKDKTLTYYKVFVGEKTLFEPGQRLGLQKIPAGANRTILAIEAGDPVPWTKPDDIPFDSKKPLPKLVAPYKRDFNVLFADARVYSIPKNFSEKKLLSGIDVNKGIDPKDLADSDE